VALPRGQVHRRERGRGGGALMGARLNRCTARAATGPHGKGEKRPPRGGAGRALPVLAHGLGRSFATDCAAFREQAQSGYLRLSDQGLVQEAAACRDQRDLSLPKPMRQKVDGLFFERLVLSFLPLASFIFVGGAKNTKAARATAKCMFLWIACGLLEPLARAKKSNRMMPLRATPSAFGATQC
jgi:hypothetical protein